MSGNPEENTDTPYSEVDVPADVDALHEIEVGTEWIRRAHGHLLAFHHAVGHGVDHFASAESPLAAAGYDDLAARIRDDLLHRGVMDGDRWSYDVVETFETTFLDPVTTVETDARQAVSDGRRHVRERRQRQRWLDRSTKTADPQGSSAADPTETDGPGPPSE
jgi:hypothetical protein